MIRRVDLQNPGRGGLMADVMSKRRTRGPARLFFGTVPDDHIQRAYRVRVGLFFLLVVIIVAALFLIYQLTQTLYQLHLVRVSGTNGNARTT